MGLSGRGGAPVAGLHVGALVHELYGLTEDEIAIVEGTL
jgi:hypothetical protein